MLCQSLLHETEHWERRNTVLSKDNITHLEICNSRQEAQQVQQGCLPRKTQSGYYFPSLAER